ncbi:MAG: ligB [Paenibacillaceae bacterium]|nr:ligB [Paenibacillaceae bacterium]
MLPVSVEEPFDDPDYLFEPQIAGHRLLLRRQNSAVKLFTRFGNECTRQYPELLAMPTDDDLVLDGQVCRFGENGYIEDEAVMERFRMTQGMKIREAAAAALVHVVVFDILQRNGEDLRALPLLERKQILSRCLDDNPRYSHVLYLPDEGKRLFAAIREREMKGMIAKRKDSPYTAGYSEDWKKIHRYSYAVVELGGYRKDQFGWLALSQGSPAGVIEKAVAGADKGMFYATSAAVKTGEDRNFVYVKPGLQVKIRYRGRTADGLLRAPEFIEFV